MTAPLDGISEAEWLSWPPSGRTIIVAHQEEFELLRGQLSSMATELVNLRERIGRISRNFSKPPSSDSQYFKPLERRQGSGRKRGG
jgi:hypothetical protein